MNYKFLNQKGQLEGPKLRLALTSAMHSLEQAHDKLAQAMRDDTGYPIWAYGNGNFNDPRLQVLEAIRLLDYQPDQGGTDSLLCPALVGASNRTLAHVQEVNVHRAELAKVLKQFVGIEVLVEDEHTGNIVNRQWVRIVLAMLGHARLNQRQATRIFRCFDKSPSQVSYSWVNMRKVEYTTSRNIIQDLEKRLEKNSGAAAKALEADYNKVAALGHAEPLAIVTPLREQVRANVAWTDKNNNTVKRSQFYAGAPIFYPAQLGSSLPKLRKLPDKDAPRSFRMKRSDLKLETEPLIPRLRIYRYRPEYREEAKQRASKRHSRG